jgi:hypothetical protein
VDKIPLEENEMKKWQCGVCGYIHEGETPPDNCPVCGADKSYFVELIDNGGSADEVAASAGIPEAAGEQTEPSPKTTKGASGPRHFDLGPMPETRFGRLSHFVMNQMLKHHAHPIMAHIPNGVLPASFIFLALGLWFESKPLAVTAYCNFIFVAITLPLVLISGYVEWKKRYKGARTRRFITKITCAGLVTISVLTTVIWWSIQPGILQDISGGRSIFLLVNLVGLIATIIAGLIGGKLVFRD